MDSPIQVFNDQIIKFTNLIHVGESVNDNRAENGNFDTLFDELAEDFPVKELDTLKKFIIGMDF